MTLSERVTVADFESEHFASQLIDRLRWAVGDAHQAEQTGRANHRHERSGASPSRSAR